MPVLVLKIAPLHNPDSYQALAQWRETLRVADQRLSQSTAGSDHRRKVGTRLLNQINPFTAELCGSADGGAHKNRALTLANTSDIG